MSMSYSSRGQSVTSRPPNMNSASAWDLSAPTHPFPQMTMNRGMASPPQVCLFVFFVCLSFELVGLVLFQSRSAVSDS